MGRMKGPANMKIVECRVTLLCAVVALLSGRVSGATADPTRLFTFPPWSFEPSGHYGRFVASIDFSKGDGRG